MRKLTSVIIINPSISLFPLSNCKQPDFDLPIVNEPILSFNLRWISPISSKIIIVCIEDHIPFVEKSIKYSNIENETVLHKVCEYKGFYQTVTKLAHFIDTENVLIYAGDFFSKIEANKIYKYYYETKADFLSVFYKKVNEKFTLCSYNENNLFYYTEEHDNMYKIKPDFFSEHEQVKFSKKFKLLHFYIVNKKVLKFKPKGLSFKNEIFPAMINQYRTEKPIKMMICEKNEMIQINSLEKYRIVNRLVKIANSYVEWSEEIVKKNLHMLFEYKCKNKKRVMFKDQDDTRKSVVGINLKKTDNIVIFNSILGSNVTLGNNTKIGTSIIMDGVTIGNNCVIEKCIIGYNAFIADDTIINGCTVSCNYYILSAVQSKEKSYYRVDL